MSNTTHEPCKFIRFQTTAAGDTLAVYENPLLPPDARNKPARTYAIPAPPANLNNAEQEG